MKSQAERIVTATRQTRDTPEDAGGLRPTTLDTYVGQSRLRERLRIAMDASGRREDPMEHLLLHGPPGLGKTTLAHIVASEMGTRAWVTSGPALSKGSDLVGTLTRMQHGDVLFIDEIHRLPAAVEEYIYPAMEDFKIDFTLDSGMHARVVTYRLKPFTLIGATTRAGLLTAALRSRFGITHRLDFYPTEELITLLERAVDRIGMDRPSADTLAMLADRSRGTPRICLRLLRRARDYAMVRHDGVLDTTVLQSALALEGIDNDGLDTLDRDYLRTLLDIYDGGPVGVEALGATLAEDPSTLEDLVEPFLLQAGLLARTRQGRQLTAAGRALMASERSKKT